MFPYECRKGLWRDNFNKITDFYGIKIGIIGAGAVGRHFIRLLKNFHVDIFVYDPYMTEKQIFELGAKKCELSYLLKESDVISLHAPLLPSTEKMINRENLKLIKDGAVLINTSRGKLIDEIALIEECKKERFTVVLDVTYPEPPAKDSPLRSLPNVFLLPHIGGVTTNGDARLGNFACEEASRFFSGEELIGKVDLSKLSVLA